MVRISGRIVLLVVLFTCALSSIANAQSVSASRQSRVGFVGGASIDPEQAFVGVFWQSPEIGGRIHIRPGIDGGFGDDLKLATINVDFIARFSLGTSGWDLIQGGGPTITLARYEFFGGDDTEVGAGGSYIIGFAHDSGFLGEFRIGGGGNVPNLKLVAGYALSF